MNTQMNGAHGDLRLQPQAIPQLKQAYQQALGQLEGVLAEARSGFRIESPQCSHVMWPAPGAAQMGHAWKAQPAKSPPRGTRPTP